MSVTSVSSFWLRHADKAVTAPVRAKISGQLPGWLHGNLFRNGSGVKEIGPDRYNHLFDGLACVHKFHIDGAGGQVTYQNRFLESDDYRDNMAAGRIEVSSFGTLGRQDLCRSLFGRLMSTFRDLSGPGAGRQADNCAVSVGYFGPELYAMTEGSRIWRLNQDDLSADKQVDLSKVVSVNGATAHPHVGPDGTVFNVGSSFVRGKTPCVNIIEFPGSGNPVAESGRVVGSIPHRWPLEPSYFHSFGITPNYFVFVQQPLVIQVKKLLMLKLKKRPITEAIAAKPDEGTWIRLVDRRTGQLHPTTFTCDTFYAYHHVNAYEEDGHVVTDICCQLPSEQSIMEIATEKYLSSSAPEGDGPMLRFVLPLETKTEDGPEANQVHLPGESAAAHRRPDGTVHCVPLTMGPPEYRTVDLPRINYAYNGAKYRYAYMVRFVGAAGNSERLVKLDLETSTNSTWCDPEWSPSEPVFVARPGDGAEDAGVLLASLLHVTDPRRTALLVLDAATMTELARAEVATDATIAKDFHGLFAATGDAVHGF